MRSGSIFEYSKLVELLGFESLILIVSCRWLMIMNICCQKGHKCILRLCRGFCLVCVYRVLNVVMNAEFLRKIVMLVVGGIVEIMERIPVQIVWFVEGQVVSYAQKVVSVLGIFYEKFAFCSVVLIFWIWVLR